MLQLVAFLQPVYDKFGWSIPRWSTLRFEPTTIDRRLQSILLLTNERIGRMPMKKKNPRGNWKKEEEFGYMLHDEKKNPYQRWLHGAWRLHEALSTWRRNDRTNEVLAACRRKGLRINRLHADENEESRPLIRWKWRSDKTRRLYDDTKNDDTKNKNYRWT